MAKRPNKNQSKAVVPELVSIKIELAIRYYRLIDFPFYIPKGKEGKTQISHLQSNLLSKLEGYRQKGLKELYLLPEHLNHFTQLVQESVDHTIKLSNGLSEIADLYAGVRSRFLSYGINAYDLMIAEEINQATLERIEEVPNLATLVSTYSKRCGNEFFNYLLMSYILTMLANAFPWSSRQIKIKLGMACLMCDLTLKPEDYELMDRVSDNSKLPASIRNHPLESARIIYNLDPTIAHEVIQMIELHHEEPDGSGYPAGVGQANIPLLPSIFIVGRFVADRLRQYGNEPERLEEILKETYDRYKSGIFIQISLALFKVFGLKEKELK